MQSVCRRWIGSASVRAAALAVALLSAGGARGQSAPWGWDTGGPAKAVWTPQNLAEFLLTGQTPHPAVARIMIKRGACAAPPPPEPRVAPPSLKLPVDLGGGLRPIGDPELRACLESLAGALAATSGPPVVGSGESER